MWENISAYWGNVGEIVTPQWYGERAIIMGVEPPEVVITRIGLVIDGEVVATPIEDGA